MGSGYVDLSLLDLTFFPVFLPSWEKKDSVSQLFQDDNSFGQNIFKPEILKSFMTLFYHMCASTMPSSVWYIQWRVQLSPSVFYSVLSATSF